LVGGSAAVTECEFQREQADDAVDDSASDEAAAGEELEAARVDDRVSVGRAPWMVGVETERIVIRSSPPSGVRKP
jgi:hypothetical protein